MEIPSGVGGKRMRLIHCKDCKHQEKHWHEDKRMKEGGYWVYNCDLISDPFESTPVCGQPDEYCSSAEMRGEENGK